jgi:16S rRNA (cytosine1402-N4)-methyltransferase
MREALAARGIRQVAGVLLDIGVSSPQLDDPARGFSFMREGPLDMRMDTTRGETASQWLDRAEERQIREVIFKYGEERFAKQIAAAIVAARPIVTTRQLAEIVGRAVRTREPGQHPATRTFQALRIHVNQELEELEVTLPRAAACLEPGGRLAVISFHSLEDRIVKTFIRERSRADTLPKGLPVRARDLPAPELKAIGKATRASDAEVARNPRARSAMLRVAEKTGEAA